MDKTGKGGAGRPFDHLSLCKKKKPEKPADRAE